MTIQWQSGCIRIEVQEEHATHPLDDKQALVVIAALAEGEREGEVRCEGQLGVQLAHLLHACVVLSTGEEEEWFVPNASHPLHLRRQGSQIEIARYPTYGGHSPVLLREDGFYLIDFSMLLESLSAAVEWLIHDLTDDFAEDDMVIVLIQQWERAWQQFSRLATFRRVSLIPL